MLDMDVCNSCLSQLMEDGLKAWSLQNPVNVFDSAVSKCFVGTLSGMSAEVQARFVIENPLEALNGPVLKDLKVDGAGLFDDKLRKSGNASFSHLMTI